MVIAFCCEGVFFYQVLEPLSLQLCPACRVLCFVRKKRDSGILTWCSVFHCASMPCHPTYKASVQHCHTWNILMMEMLHRRKQWWCIGVGVTICHTSSNLYDSIEQQCSILDEGSMVFLDRNWVQRKSLVFRGWISKQSILNLRGRWKSKVTESQRNKLQYIIHKTVLLCKLFHWHLSSWTWYRCCWRQQLWTKFSVFGKTTFHHFDFASWLSSYNIDVHRNALFHNNLSFR